MHRFQHNFEDKKIVINNTLLPYDWFLTQEPAYSVLPECCIGRIYVPNKRHHMTMLKGETPCQCEGGLDENNLWAEGDAYIAKEADYAAAYELFINPPPTQAEIDAGIKRKDVSNKREAAIEELITNSKGAAAVKYKKAKDK
jgi:hypothetical protein